MSLNNDIIGGVSKANLEALSNICPGNQIASLAEILDQFQTDLTSIEGFWADPVADLAAIKAVAAANRVDKQLRLVESLGIYRFDSTSAATGNDVTVIVPTAGTGRWLLVASLVEAFDIGGVGYNFIRFTGVPNVDDAFTVAGRSYEFDTTGAGVDIVRVGGDVDATLDNAVAAINGDAAATVAAYKMAGSAAGNGVLLLVGDAINVASALVVTVNVAVAMTVNAATSMGNKDADHRRFSDTVHTISAQEVLALAAGEGIAIAQFPRITPPASYTLFARDATNIALPINGLGFEWVQVGANFWALELTDPLAAGVFAAGDFINVHTIL